MSLDPKKTVVVGEITSDWVAENLPEIAAHLRGEGKNSAQVASDEELEAARREGAEQASKDAGKSAEEAVESERARIAAIADMAAPGQEKLVSELIKDGSSEGEAAKRLLKDAQENGGKVLESLRKATEADPPKAGENEDGSNKSDDVQGFAKNVVEMARAHGAVR